MRCIYDIFLVKLEHLEARVVQDQVQEAKGSWSFFNSIEESEKKKISYLVRCHRLLSKALKIGK
jgi:hypothetical protein